MNAGKSMKRHVFSFFLFLMICSVVFVLIKFANWLPLALQSDTLRRYGSIEEVRAALPDLHVYVPTYFPQTISWPPEHLFAQNKPFPWLLMKFKHRDSSEEALIITQSGSAVTSEQVPGVFEEISEKVTFQLRGRRAVLEVGLCKNGKQCSRITWDEGDHRYIVFMTSSPLELIKIAKSMLH